MEERLTVKEVARILKVSPGYVRNVLVGRRRLKYARLPGGRGPYRFRPAWVEELMGEPLGQCQHRPTKAEIEAELAEARRFLRLDR